MNARMAPTPDPGMQQRILDEFGIQLGTCLGIDENGFEAESSGGDFEAGVARITLVAYTTRTQVARILGGEQGPLFSPVHPGPSDYAESYAILRDPHEADEGEVSIETAWSEYRDDHPNINNPVGYAAFRAGYRHGHGHGAVLDSRDFRDDV